MTAIEEAVGALGRHSERRKREQGKDIGETEIDHFYRRLLML